MSLSENAFKKLQKQRYSHGLSLLNIKFHTSQEFLDPEIEGDVALIRTPKGTFKIVSSTIPELEYLITPLNKRYAILWKEPYLGIILSEFTNLQEIKEIVGLYKSARNIELEPEVVESIKIPTAGKGINNSIKKLSYEAKFLKKKVMAAEIMDCITRTRQLVTRAIRTHQDALPAILNAENRKAEASIEENGKEKRTVLNTKKKIPSGKSNVPSVQKKAKQSGTPQKRKGKVPLRS
jgi:hypothetical protein